MEQADPTPLCAVENWKGYLGCRGPSRRARDPSPTLGPSARKRSPYNFWLSETESG